MEVHAETFWQSNPQNEKTKNHKAGQENRKIGEHGARRKSSSRNVRPVDDVIHGERKAWGYVLRKEGNGSVLLQVNREEVS